MPTLKTGITAFFDSLNGPVPVKILSVVNSLETPSFDLSDGQAKACIRVRSFVIEKSGPYQQGEVIEGNSINFFPKESLRQHKYCTTIAPYDVQPDEVN